MSVNSKMTAIADQIRELRGMSGSLSLDTMNTRLEEVRGYISDAFTAIGNKGGSLPGYQVSPNLATAIASIPTKSTPQVFTGSVTGRGISFNEEIICGFQPDIVIIVPPEEYIESSKQYTNNMCVCLSDMEIEETCIPRCHCGTLNISQNVADVYTFGCYVTKTENGFTLGSFIEIAFTGEFAYSTKTVIYAAIKF